MRYSFHVVPLYKRFCNRFLHMQTKLSIVNILQVFQKKTKNPSPSSSTQVKPMYINSQHMPGILSDWVVFLQRRVLGHNQEQHPTAPRHSSCKLYNIGVSGMNQPLWISALSITYKNINICLKFCTEILCCTSSILIWLVYSEWLGI